MAQSKSRKKKWKESMKSCIKCQRGIHAIEACQTCQVDCAIARKADRDHWANEAALDPVYQGVNDCPKAKNLKVLLDKDKC